MSTHVLTSIHAIPDCISKLIKTLSASSSIHKKNASISYTSGDLFSFGSFVLSTRNNVLVNSLNYLWLMFRGCWIHIYLQNIPHFDFFNPLKCLSVQLPSCLLAGNSCIYEPIYVSYYLWAVASTMQLGEIQICFRNFKSKVLDFVEILSFSFLCS